MSVNRERNYAFEELCDKYLHLVDSMSEKFSLDEDQKQDLVVLLCEYLQNHISRGVGVTYHGVYSMVKNAAKRIICQQRYPDWEVPASECAINTVDQIEDRVRAEQLRSTISTVLETLTPREATILRMRFFECKSLRDCGSVLGISGDTVRQLEGKALCKLRHPSRSNALKSYMDDSYAPKGRQHAVVVREPRKVFLYRAPYELGMPVWQETLGDRTVSIYDRKGYVIHLEEGRASWYVNGKTLRTCRLADATRYKTLEDAMVASKVLLSPSTSLVSGRILIPERVALFPRKAVPEYDVCRIVGTESYVIHCGYFNQHRFLNQGGYKWGPLEDATKFTDTAVPASLIELAYGENEGVVFPVCHF